ncbi:MAG: D-alanine--D-alanine ligase [bacterium]|nr:D-alanine--D-alanine ligase [bacterium]
MALGATWTTWRTPGVRGELARTPVVVLYGGTSSERDVSLVSGRSILTALGEAPPEAPDVPGEVIGVEIDADGGWRVGSETVPAPRALSSLPRDAVFLLGLHGGSGENGTLQGFLETAGRRYTGSGVAASALCMDKHHTRLVLEEAGLAVAPGALLERGTPRAAALRKLVDAGGPPWFVKPNGGGSSVDMYRVEEADHLTEAVARVQALGSDALVEVGIVGTEVTCGVIGNDPGTAVPLPLVEIRPKEGRFFDYEEKYSETGAVELCPPETVDDETTGAVQAAAHRAFAVTGCTGYARVDFMLPEGGGPPVALEVNTLPGFTPASLLPKEAAATGVPFRELCLELVALAIERFR